jgi:hypothetical protein
VQSVVTEYLWPLPPGGATAKGWPMGETVRVNELLTQAARAEGVQSVNGASLFLKTSKGWRRLPQTEELDLTLYQLPELMGVRVEVGSAKDTPQLPQGIGPLVGSPPEPANGIAVPVIPDVC